MRTCSYLAMSLFLISVVMTGCKSYPISEEQHVVNLLARTWSTKGGKVSLDKVDVSGSFLKFKITFNPDKTFTSSEGNSPVWPNSGMYEFESINGGKILNRILRNDGVPITLEALSENNLRITFQFIPVSLGGRRSEVPGEYEFELVSQ